MDGGTVWDELGTVADANGYCTGNALAADPVTTSVLYVGGDYYDYSTSSTYMSVGRTTDQGGSWTFGHTSQDYGNVYAVAVDPFDPRTLYAGGYSAAGEHMHRSTDGGRTWSNITPGGCGTINAIAVDPVTTSTLYCGDYSGVYRSTDGGASWVQRGSFGAEAIAVDPSAPSELYASGYAGVFNSTDGGETWAPMSDGLGDVRVTVLQHHPVQRGFVYAGTAGGGVFEYEKQASIGVTSPAAGVEWRTGDSENIEWASWGTSGLVQIELSRDGGGAWLVIASSVADVGIHTWAVSGPPSSNCQIRVSDVDGSPSGTSGTFTIAEIAAEDPLVAETLAVRILGGNPVKGPVSLACAIPEPCGVAVGVYDTQGRLLHQPHRGWLSAGRHVFRWHRDADGEDVAAGLYVCRLEACGRVISRPFVLLR